MLKNTTISALALAVAIISAQAQASVKQTTFDNNPANAVSIFGASNTGDAFAKKVANSPEATPVVVAWSRLSGTIMSAKPFKKDFAISDSDWMDCMFNVRRLCKRLVARGKGGGSMRNCTVRKEKRCNGKL